MANTTWTVLLPRANEAPAPISAELVEYNRRPALKFNEGVAAAAVWTTVAPIGAATVYEADIFVVTPDDASGNINWSVELEAITASDAHLISAGDFFHTANTGASAVDAAVDEVALHTVVLTNNDSVAAGDLVRLRLKRLAADSDATDTATTPAYVLAIHLRHGDT